MERKVQGVARNIQNCATTILVGGWKRATIPTSSPGGCCPATEEILCFATVFLSSTHHISQCFANHISDGRRVWLTELVMHSGCASTQLLLIITAAAHISCLYLSKWWIVFPNLTWSYLWWGNFAPPYWVWQEQVHFLKVRCASGNVLFLRALGNLTTLHLTSPCNPIPIQLTHSSGAFFFRVGFSLQMPEIHMHVCLVLLSHFQIYQYIVCIWSNFDIKYFSWSSDLKCKMLPDLKSIHKKIIRCYIHLSLFCI